MRRQVTDLGVKIIDGTVETLTRSDLSFTVHLEAREMGAAKVILASGGVDKQPHFDGWEKAVQEGLLRYCPICDAYEALGKKLAVIGSLGHAAGKALFLRSYTADVTLVPEEGEPNSEGTADITESGVKIRAPLSKITRNGVYLRLTFRDGTWEDFEGVYPAMGTNVRSELAIELGAAHTDSGLLKVDDKQRTTVEGLYGIGDVVSDLHQVSVALGHAAIAACNIHHSLPQSFVK
jgi:thioredoxin reductase (NADPH)